MITNTFSSTEAFVAAAKEQNINLTMKLMNDSQFIEQASTLLDYDSIVVHILPSTPHAHAIGQQLEIALQAGVTVVTVHHSMIDPAYEGDWGKFTPTLVSSKPSRVLNTKPWSIKDSENAILRNLPHKCV